MEAHGLADSCGYGNYTDRNPAAGARSCWNYKLWRWPWRLCGNHNESYGNPRL